MTKLRQDWVNNFQAQEGESLKYITVTDTVSSTTGSKTNESLVTSAAFTALFEIVVEDDRDMKAGHMATGDAYALIPKSYNAKMRDRIEHVSSGTIFEIDEVDQRKTHDALTLVEYMR